MNKTLNIALGQMNPTVGDIAGNVARMADMIRQGSERYGADLIIFPELALTGYPPEDLLLRTDFMRRVTEGLEQLCQYVMGIDCVVGYPRMQQGRLYNSAAYLRGGAVLAVYDKRVLPNYGVFDEQRYFTAGQQACVVELKGCQLALVICEDIWEPEPARASALAGAELIISINASPYHAGKLAQRQQILKQRCAENGLPIVYVQLVGGQDEVVFDGACMALSAQGEVVHQGRSFVEDVQQVTFENGCLRSQSGNVLSESRDARAEIYAALVVGVRDYVKKNAFRRVLIGLSGGIDSALTACIAVDALGPANVETLMLPSRYTSAMSLEDAAVIAQNLQIQHACMSIESVFESALCELQFLFADAEPDVTEENLQSRCRGLLLMAVSNKRHLLVLTTGNKSEMAVGYATLYGDMVGAFAPLKDVSKTRVYELCLWRNALSAVIPQRVLERPPSAELAFDQKDEDSLPPYAVLDEILRLYIEEYHSVQQIVAAGFEESVVVDVVRRVNFNEYKRRQSAPGVKITACSFGRERRYPMTSGYNR